MAADYVDARSYMCSEKACPKVGTHDKAMNNAQRTSRMPLERSPAETLTLVSADADAVAGGAEKVGGGGGGGGVAIALVRGTFHEMPSTS